MKLNKDNRPKISLKMVASAAVVIFVVFIAATSLSKGGFRNGSQLSAVDPLNYIGSGINSVVTSTGDFLSDIIYFRSNSNKVKELSAENEKLRQQVIDLKSDNARYDSLKMLKKELNFVDSKYKAKLISASIIGKNDGNWYESFVIDAGRNQGVQDESIVINGKGAVGMVYSVSSNYSKAISLVDSNSAISFVVPGKENTKGMITNSAIAGTGNAGGSKKMLRGYLFDSKGDIKKGDLIVTSGLGLFPENIPIGKVVDATYDKSKSMKIIRAVPNVDFENLNEVSIIPPRRIE